jgi:hypothetical protein
MSIACSVRADGDRLIINDEDGGIWQYARGKVASGDPTVQVDWTWTPIGNPAVLVPGPDGKPLLHQTEKGLPKTIIVGVVEKDPPIAGAPMPGGFVGGGRYEFEQVPA